MFFYHSVRSEVEKKVCVSREPYLKLTPSQRAAEHGVTATIRYFSQRFQDIELKELQLEQLKIITLTDLRKRKYSEDSKVTELFCKKRGRPLLLGEKLDYQVRAY